MQEKTSARAAAVQGKDYLIKEKWWEWGLGMGEEGGEPVVINPVATSAHPARADHSPVSLPQPTVPSSRQRWPLPVIAEGLGCTSKAALGPSWLLMGKISVPHQGQAAASPQQSSLTRKGHLYR